MLFAVISFKRSDGKPRKVPRIYPESVAQSRSDAWRALLENNAGAAAMAGPDGGYFARVGALRSRLNARAVPVKLVVDDGNHGCLAAPSTAPCDMVPGEPNCPSGQDPRLEEPEDGPSCVPWWMHWPSYRILFQPFEAGESQREEP